MSDKDKYDELSPQADHWKRKADEFYKQWQMTETKLAQAQADASILREQLAEQEEELIRTCKEIGDAGVLITEGPRDGVVKLINQRDELREQLAEARKTAICDYICDRHMIAKAWAKYDGSDAFIDFVMEWLAANRERK